MDFVYIGDVVNTHGLKGELRILSSFSHKEEIFKPNFYLYIEEKPYKIKTYRKHKNYDMVTFEGFTTIEDVLFLKGKATYINRKEIDSTLLLESDYLNMEVYSEKGNRGKVVSILKGVAYNYLEVALRKKTYYIPLIPPFIDKVIKEENQVWIHEIEGLLDED